MKITFPDSLDALNLQPDRLAKNDAESSHTLRPDDILYIVDELERKVGANNSTDPASLEFRVSALEELTTMQNARLGYLQSLITALQSVAEAFTFRSNKTDVLAAGTVVNFPSPMTGEYIILGSCYNASGELVGYVVSGQSPDGFTVTPDQDGTLEWIAVQIN